MKRVSTIFLLLLLVVACSRDSNALRQVSRTLDGDPQAALSQLDSLDRAALSPRLQAEYDYLSAMAFYRSFYFLDEPHSVALARAYRYKEQERSRLSNLALLVAAILATLVLYFWARKAQMEKLLLLEKEENERMLSTAEDLQARLGVLKTRGGKSPLDMLDRLCEQYYVYEGTDNLQPRILKEVRSVVEGLRSDASMQRSLEQSLNEGSQQVMARLRAAFPKWKEEDFLLYLFAASGFSSTTISTLLEKDKPYVYNRLYRLKERIRNSDSPDKGLFLACLEK